MLMKPYKQRRIAVNKVVLPAPLGPSNPRISPFFTVRDIFYNVPARRKFLKPNETEFKHIVSVFEQITLAHPHIEFRLFQDEKLKFCLLKENNIQRFCSLFGKKWSERLIHISVNTTIGNIYGYVGTPNSAMKKGVPQFLFANNRYIQHPYFNKAICMAYEKILFNLYWNYIDADCM